MFKTLQNAFKIKEIRQKLFYTFLMLIVIRFGSKFTMLSGPAGGDTDPEFYQADMGR